MRSIGLGVIIGVVWVDRAVCFFLMHTATIKIPIINERLKTVKAITILAQTLVLVPIVKPAWVALVANVVVVVVLVVIVVVLGIG